MSGRKMSTKEKEDEELRKIERNRIAYEGWLEKKKEERRKQALEQQHHHTSGEELERRRAMSQAAYQRWLKQKQYEDELMLNDRAIGRQIDRMREEEKKADRKKVKESYNSWKMQKDLETRLERKYHLEDQEQLTDIERRGQDVCTPPLAGYCSVWSCDEELGDYVLDRVQRGGAYTLSDYSELQQNFTIDHDYT